MGYQFVGEKIIFPFAWSRVLMMTSPLIIVPQLDKFLKFMAFWGVIFCRVQ